MVSPEKATASGPELHSASCKDYEVVDRHVACLAVQTTSRGELEWDRIVYIYACVNAWMYVGYGMVLYVWYGMASHGMTWHGMDGM